MYIIQIVYKISEKKFYKGKPEGKHFIYTPLHGWVTEKMRKKGGNNVFAYDLIDSDDSGDNSDDENDATNLTKGE